VHDRGRRQQTIDRWQRVRHLQAYVALDMTPPLRSRSIATATPSSAAPSKARSLTIVRTDADGNIFLGGRTITIDDKLGANHDA
jgi:hypothetical protein